MGDLKIWWKYVGVVSAMSGLICFPLSSTYKMSFGKLGNGGLLFYLLVCLITRCLILLAQRYRVPEKAKGVVGVILFVVINSISVVHDKYVPGKSDAFTITSYGSFALMSVSLSGKLELGFETGFSAFFLQLFAAQLYKIKWFLYPIALVFSSLVIILRHYRSESGAESDFSISDEGNELVEVENGYRLCSLELLRRAELTRLAEDMYRESRRAELVKKESRRAELTRLAEDMYRESRRAELTRLAEDMYRERMKIE